MQWATRQHLDRDTGPPSWQFHATDYIPPPGGINGTGAVIGYIDGIRMHLVGSTILGTCAFDLTGSVDAIYHNPSSGGANGTLQSAGGSHQLTASNKVGGGCATIGTTATLRFTYTVRIGSVSPVIVGS